MFLQNNLKYSSINKTLKTRGPDHPAPLLLVLTVWENRSMRGCRSTGGSENGTFIQMGWFSSDECGHCFLLKLRGYLLRVEVPVRRVLGSLSDPGIFQGPGETVAFLPAAMLLLLVLLLGRLGQLSPWPLSSSLGLGLLCSSSPCFAPLQRSTSSLLFPLMCGSLELLGEWVDSLLSLVFLSLDLPLLLLEGLGSLLCPSLPPSPSGVGCILRPLWVDLPPSFLALLLPLVAAALLAWPIGSGFSSSAFWGLFECSVLLSRATGSRWTSWGGRWGRSGAGARWDEGDDMERLSMGGAISDRLGEAEGRPSHGAALSGMHMDAVNNNITTPLTQKH